MSAAPDLVSLGVFTLKLPELVETCGFCFGHGQYMQRWCDAPRSPGACDLCDGAQWVYRERVCGSDGVSESVRRQIANMNGLVEDFSGTCLVVRCRGRRLYKPPQAITFGVCYAPERKELSYGWTVREPRP